MNSKHYEHHLAVAMVFQDCARFLAEWIEFHRLMGVEKFHLYNNASTDDCQRVLAPYVASGLVELLEWGESFERFSSWDECQNNAYDHALQKTIGKVKWLAFIDSDEFLFPVTAETLPPILDQYSSFGGVCVNWQTFGTAHIERVPDDKLLTECLQLALPANVKQNLHVKSIVRPERCQRAVNPHYLIYKPGYFQVDTDGNRFGGPFSDSVLNDKLRINHYRYRDEQYYREHKAPRRKKWKLQEDEELYRLANTVSDSVIQRFVPELKRRIRL